MEKPYYVQVLQEEFEQKKRRSPAYSQRAFCHFLGITSPVLSEVLRGKRNLPFKYGEMIASKLELPPQRRQLFLSSLRYSKASLRHLVLQGESLPDKDYTRLNEERDFKIIAEWEHYAVLSLLDLDDFTLNSVSVAERLNLSCERAEKVLANLKQSGLIEQNQNKRWVKKFKKLTTTKEINSVALQKSHKESLDLAKEKISSTPVEERQYLSSTIAANPEKLDQAKDLVREFRTRLCDFLQEGEKSIVFQLNFQLFPLTDNQNNRTKTQGVSHANL